MKTIVLKSFLIVLFLCVNCLSQNVQIPDENIHKLINNTCIVSRGKSMGTGTLINTGSQDVTVFTCAHLVDDGDPNPNRMPFYCYFPYTKERIQAYAVRCNNGNSTNDLCVLKLSASPTGLPGAYLSNKPEQSGEVRYLIGYAGAGSSSVLKVHRGQTIVGRAQWGDGTPITGITVPSISGMSGGPVADEEGFVRSVITSSGGGQTSSTSCRAVSAFITPLFPRLYSIRANRIQRWRGFRPLPIIGRISINDIYSPHNGSGSAIQCPDGNCPPQWNQPTPATPPPFGSNLPVPPPTDLEPLELRVSKIESSIKNLELKYDNLDSRIVKLEDSCLEPPEINYDEIVKLVMAKMPPPQVGPVGPQGPKGKDGRNGKDGKDGKDAVVSQDMLAAMANAVGVQVYNQIKADPQFKIDEDALIARMKKELPSVTIDLIRPGEGIERRVQPLSNGDATFQIDFTQSKFRK
jgi:hypothetical protein